MDVRFTPFHPFRDPNWRYEKSRNCLLKHGRPTWHLGKDPWKDQFRFLKKLVRCRNDYDRSRLMRESPAHYFAFELYCDSESGLRAVVEARLLAGETFSSIGARLGLTGSVIETYAQCYFDVQTRLGHVDFIHNHVLNQNSKSNKFLLRKASFRPGRTRAERAICGKAKLCSALMLLHLVFSRSKGPKVRWRRGVSHRCLLGPSIVAPERRQVMPCLASTTRLWANTPRPSAAWNRLNPR